MEYYGGDYSTTGGLSNSPSVAWSSVAWSISRKKILYVQAQDIVYFNQIYYNNVLFGL